MSYWKSQEVGKWQERIAKVMEIYSGLAGLALFIVVLFEVGYYMIHGNYYLPHPDLRADFGTMMKGALLYWGLPFAIALSPIMLADRVRKTEDLGDAVIWAIFGTIGLGILLTFLFGIGLFILNFPLSLIVLVIHLVLGAFAFSAAYGVIVTIFFVCIGVGVFSVTAGPTIYYVVIVIFKGK